MDVSGCVDVSWRSVRRTNPQMLDVSGTYIVDGEYHGYILSAVPDLQIVSFQVIMIKTGFYEREIQKAASKRHQRQEFLESTFDSLPDHVKMKLLQTAATSSSSK